MRTMLKWTVPVERGNEAVVDGTIAATIQALMETLQPEAAYFMTDHGERGGLVIFDMTDPAQIPQIAEPLFQSLDANVDFVPVMNADDLKRALDAV